MFPEAIVFSLWYFDFWCRRSCWSKNIQRVSAGLHDQSTPSLNLEKKPLSSKITGWERVRKPAGEVESCRTQSDGGTSAGTWTECSADARLELAELSQTLAGKKTFLRHERGKRMKRFCLKRLGKWTSGWVTGETRAICLNNRFLSHSPQVCISVWLSLSICPNSSHLLTVCLCLHLSINLCLSHFPSVCLSVFLSVCLSLHIYLPVCHFIYRQLSIPVSVFICQSVRLLNCLFDSPTVCL